MMSRPGDGEEGAGVRIDVGVLQSSQSSLNGIGRVHPLGEYALRVGMQGEFPDANMKP